VDLRRGEHVRYRFVSDVGRTRWFEATVGGWVAGMPGVREAGRTRIVPGSGARLDDGERTRRVRFALRLEPGERVVGFGERYDALDHRGSSLDSVVFEHS
jgi:hypothetical protein